MRKIVFAVLGIAGLLTGCQTIPMGQPNGSTALAAPVPNTVQVRLTEFTVPKEEGGVKLLHFLVGGPGLGQPIGASIYDVTQDIRFLGHLSLGGYGFYLRRGAFDWLDVSLPAGRRTLMLVEAPIAKSIALAENAPFRQVDFIELDLKPGTVKHLALTRHGFLTKPYFAELQISETDRRACEMMTVGNEETRDEWKARGNQINAYMNKRGIDEYARDFRAFCHKLSAPKRILAPTPDALAQFSARKSELENARTNNYPKWKGEYTSSPPYDLMKDYRPAPVEQPYQ